MLNAPVPSDYYLGNVIVIRLSHAQKALPSSLHSEYESQICIVAQTIKIILLTTTATTVTTKSLGIYILDSPLIQS